MWTPLTLIILVVEVGTTHRFCWGLRLRLLVVAEPSVPSLSCSAAVLALEVFATLFDGLHFLFCLLLLDLEMNIFNGRSVVGAIILLAVEQGLQRSDLGSLV